MSASSRGRMVTDPNLQAQATPAGEQVLLDAAIELLHAGGAAIIGPGEQPSVASQGQISEAQLAELLSRLDRGERFPQLIDGRLFALTTLAGGRRLAISLAGEQQLSSRELHAIELFAGLAAGPGNQREDESRRLLAMQVERLTLLNHVVTATSRIEDPAAACRRALELILAALPALDMASAWLVDHDQPGLSRLASSGFAPDGHLSAHLAPDSPAFVSEVARAGKSRVLHFPAGSSAPEMPPESQLFVEGNRIQTLIHIPMLTGQRLVGVLTFAALVRREVAQTEIEFLETLAGQLGGSLEALTLHNRHDAERRRLETILENLPEAIVIADSDGRIAIYNQAAEQLWGHAAHEVSLSQLPEACGLHNADGRPLAWPETPLARAILDGVPTTGREIRIRRPTGIDVPILSNCVPIRDSQGKVSGAVEVFQDISSLKEIERLKDDFINTVSHELRTPTTTIRGGALTLLRRGDSLDESTKRQLLRDMSEEAERLHILVEDLLSLSRSQAGMQLTTEPVIPHRFVNHMILEMGSRVGEHSLTVHVPADLPMVEADPFCLEQIFRNLLENAVKFSPSGHRIEIDAEAGDAEVIFSVLDRGSGIPTQDIGRVFEPFYRSDEVISAGAQGAGLGLAVCERFAHMQGGRIWAESRAGGGTAFRFTVPSIGEPTGEDD